MNPTAFITYSWDDQIHKDWVKFLATKLLGNGIKVILDVWEAIPGDQLPKFMEKSIRENDFVIIICTPNYKLKSDNRTGGVGYEGDIMTGEAFVDGQIGKFIPILKLGSPQDSLPSWLKGKYYIDFRTEDSFDNAYYDLISTLHGEREIAPKLGTKPSFDKLIPKIDCNLTIINDELIIQIASLNGVPIDFKHYIANEKGISLIPQVVFGAAKIRPKKARQVFHLVYGKLDRLENIPKDQDTKIVLSIKYESLNYSETLSNNQKGELKKNFIINIKEKKVN